MGADCGSDHELLIAKFRLKLKKVEKITRPFRVGLKLNIQKTKIMASGPITSWQIDGETVADFIFLGSKITADGTGDGQGGLACCSSWEYCGKKQYFQQMVLGLTGFVHVTHTASVYIKNPEETNPQKQIVSLAFRAVKAKRFLTSYQNKINLLLSLTFWSSITNSVKFSQRDQVSRALKTRGNTPKYRLIFHSTFIGRAAAKNKGRISRYLANKCKQVEEQLSFYETGEIPRKNLDEAAAEITRKLEKQEKKRLKKEKKRLAAIALASSENSSKKKQKPQEALQENGMEDPSVSFSKKKKYFSKEELVSSDLEETAGTGGLPKRKKSFPKEEPVTDPDESENKRAPKKKQKLSSKEEPVSGGPEEAAASKSSGSKKKKKLQKLSQES
ncbi:hypothetical protein FD755_021752 [Muntiacus reevesi]|uniref:Nucleolar protein 5A n=1 Tax=Muntiacus reevesi TaxID=9886 RepID=A0A5N3W2W8_MUNRE|nr:hypothetical protein FD755_021752 [Muntiacus reevesi]